MRLTHGEPHADEQLKGEQQPSKVPLDVVAEVVAVLRPPTVLEDRLRLGHDRPDDAPKD